MTTPDQEIDDQILCRVRTESELIHSPKSVQRCLDRMAAAVTERLGGSDPVLVAVMTGGMIPAVWLSTRLAFPHQLDYVHATRYVGSTRGGELHWRARPRLPLGDRAVLVIDDILDEGITLREIAAYCREQGASQVLTAVLVRKQHDRAVGGVEADFVGLEVPDRYVFGCGMDYHEYFRELTGIYALPAEMEDQL